MEKFNLIIENKIAVIRFMDPDNYNPLNKESAKELLEILESLRNNNKVRSVIITGSGNAFSAGGDIKKFKESIEKGTPGQFMDDLTKDLYKIAMSLKLYPKPVIAAVNGWAVGAGMNLALSCDLIIASENAKFRQSFCKLALIPGFGGTVLLSRQLTWQQATQMAFLGDTYSVSEMKDLGFVNEITSPEDLEDIALKWAKRLAEGPTLTYARTKELFVDALNKPFDEHLEYERKIQIKSAETNDFKSGVYAIIEKEDPEFSGK
ncbi:MAG: enoyl-CoA hydratase/isomerase family protein [Candidatus Lokiarchaeota archaeon]